MRLRCLGTLWAGDWWHQRILVVPAIGTDTNGNEVRGYWHDYSGAARLPRPPSGLQQILDRM